MLSPRLSIRRDDRLPACAALAAATVAMLAACADAPTGPTRVASPLSAAAPVSSQGANNGHHDRPIVYVSNPNSKLDVFIVGPDGGKPKRLTDDYFNDLQPVLSPDASRVAFVSMRDNPRGDIYVITVNGGRVTRLTSGAGASAAPSWSPDGSRIVFESTNGAVDPTPTADGAKSDIFIMNADGSHVVRLTNDAVADQLPTWSPDGDWIAFNSARDYHADPSARDLYRMHTDGTGVERLSNQQGTVQSSSWDPTSHRLVYDVVAGAYAAGLFVVDVPTMVTTQLTTNANNARDDWPSWSPDGTRIVFARGFYLGAPSNLYMMNADGTGVTPCLTGPEFSFQPRWSR